MDLSLDELENLKTQAKVLKELLDKPLPDNRAWQAKVRLTIRTISDYEGDYD